MKIDRERALARGREQVAAGVRENPSNWGPDVKKYLAVTKIFSPAPYCAAFCAFLFQNSKGAYPWDAIANPAYVPSIVEWGRSKGTYFDKHKKAPQPGDLIIFQRAGVPAHIGIIEHVDGSVLKTIEANTSSGTNTGEGDGVYRRHHEKESSWVMGWICWKDEAPVLKTPDENVTILKDGVVIAVGIIDQGRTMAPLTVLAKHFGFSVKWDQATRTAEITKG